MFRYSNLLFMKQQLCLYNFLKFNNIPPFKANHRDFIYEHYENCWCQNKKLFLPIFERTYEVPYICHFLWLLHVSIKSNHRGCNYVLPHLKKALKRPTKNDLSVVTIQKMKFSIKDLFSKCDQTHNFLRIWSHLLKKFLMENFIFSLVCMEAPTGKSLQLYLK